jgi:hypothetical protein
MGRTMKVFPRQAFVYSADCPFCGRSYFVRGSAPIAEGHRPHYFACKCGRKIMAVVPDGAEVRSVQSSPISTKKQAG